MASRVDSPSAPVENFRPAGPPPAMRKKFGYLFPFILIGASLFSIASDQMPQKSLRQVGGLSNPGVRPLAVAVPRYVPQGRPQYEGTDEPTPTPTETLVLTETPTLTETETPTETGTPTETETPNETETPTGTVTPTDTPAATETPSETETPTLTPTSTRDTGTAEAPSNDDIDGAVPISSLPFYDEIQTDEATTAADDPEISCAAEPGQQSDTVWYSFTTDIYQALFLNTDASDYDTVIAVWRGTRGSLVEVACSEDVYLTIPLAPGVYYIEIAQSGTGSGGSLAFGADADTFYGLRADYFNNVNLSGPPVLTRVDPYVDFDWSGISPAPEVNVEGFSVRWSGRVFPQYSETYTFRTYTDDGVRLWVDGQLIIDDWNYQYATWSEGSIALQAGEAYSIRMEYFQGAEDSIAVLEWSSDSQEEEVIPPEYLDYLDVENSTFVSDGTQPLADGSETSTFTVTLLDAAGDPVVGVPVYLKASGTGNRINGYGAPENTWVYIGDSNVDGQAFGYLASTVAGQKNVEAMADGVTIGGTVPVIFINGSMRRVNKSHVPGQEGDQANDQTYSPSISDDGRYVVFLSWADNLVAGDANGGLDIFILDTQSDSLSMAVFAASNGQPNDLVLEPRISANGQYIVFTSIATNLDSACTNNSYADIFVYAIADGAPGTFQCVSLGVGGAEPNGPSEHPAISADGRYVVFTSTATNLVSGVTDGHKHVYMRDRDTGSTTIISLSSDETVANGNSDNPSVSADGRYVVFESSATNLLGAGGDTNSMPDIFLRDRTAGTTIRISAAYNPGEQPNGPSTYPTISSDGTRVAFLSSAGNLIPNVSGVTNVFLRDLPSQTTTLVSMSNSGEAANSDSYGARISSDGMHVVFSSVATNLVVGESSGTVQIYLRDFVNSATFKLSESSSGEEGNDASIAPGITEHGNWITFLSDATNLVSADTNGYSDVFMLERTNPPQPPPNDDIDSAMTISAVPFANLESTLGATTAVDDPASACSEGEPSQHANSVWFTIQPATTMQLAISTVGSDYDTVLAVWTGTRGDLTELTCNDDYEDVQSMLEFTAMAGVRYWIEVVQRDEPGGGELVFSVQSTTAPPVVVTVLDTDGNPDVGLTVQAYNGNTNTGYSGVTNEVGQATITLPAGSYRFRTVKNGLAFWSGETNHCTVPGCASAGITTTISVTVTVLNLDLVPEPGLNVQVYNGDTYAGYNATTNAEGQVTFTLPEGSYRFRTYKAGRFFWSDSENHCSVPGCNMAYIVVDNTVVVTVLDTDGNPKSGLNVLAYDGPNYVGIAAYTNAQGEATLALPEGSYRFRVAENGTAFWSGETNHCTIPGCASAGITVTIPVVVTVLDTDGQPEAGLNVKAYVGDESAGYAAYTNAQGQATLSLPVGSYRFRVAKNGTAFWSDTENSCTIPGCTEAAITTTLPMVVTVLNLSNQPEAGLTVQVFNGTVYAGYNATTDAQGQVTFTLPEGSYRFRVLKNGRFFYSGPANHCTIPGCTEAGITVDNTVMVTVLDSLGNPDGGLSVRAYDGDTYMGIAATTNAQGQAFLALPEGSYRFRVAKNGTAFWSGTSNHCTVIGCTEARITTTVPVVITVLDTDGQPDIGLTVQAYDGSTYVSYSGTSNGLGQVSFTMPEGNYRFRAVKNGVAFWSGTSNHCSVPGCTSAAITTTIPVTVTVLNLSGQPEAGLSVQVFDDSTYAGYSATTNAQGQVTFTMTGGSYRFRTMKNGRFFWSGGSNHCSIPGCTTAGITVDNTVVVTVLDTGGNPEAGLSVRAYDGDTYMGIAAYTNSQGQAALALPAGNFRFRVAKNGTAFWSETSNHCTVPGCTSASITTTLPVTITVLDSNSAPELGLTVQAYNGSTYVWYSGVTNGSGQVTFTLPQGSYRFRAVKNGTVFWSGTSNHCTVPGCTSASITTTIPVAVTILNLSGQPEAGLSVQVFNESTYAGYASVTDAQGQVTFTLPQGSYRFRALKGNRFFWSGPSNHCTLPGCTDVGMTVDNTVVVTVLDTGGNPEAGLNVLAYDGSTYMGYAAYTNAQGQASLVLPSGSYRFRVAKNGTAFWSGTSNHCTVVGCTSAGITTTLPVTVTVLDGLSQPEVGLTVQVYNGTTYVSYSGTTNTSGQVSFTLPMGNYRFRALKNGTAFWSGTSNHCTVPGCTSASVATTLPVVVTVLDGMSQPEVGLLVQAWDESTYTGYSGTTNASGEVSLTLPPGSYRFRAYKGAYSYWSGASNHCTVPGCTSASISTGGVGFTFGPFIRNRTAAGVISMEGMLYAWRMAPQAQDRLVG
jgi:hypothetical protein